MSNKNMESSTEYSANWVSTTTEDPKGSFELRFTEPYYCTPKIRIVCDKDLMPAHATKQAAGFDLKAAEPGLLMPGERKLVPTSLHIALLPGMEMQVRPRSGLAWKHGITVLNSPGTIDADYRGEVKVMLVNHGQGAWSWERGERIAQGVIAGFVNLDDWKQEVASLEDDTERGSGGFGSTGTR